MLSLLVSVSLQVVVSSTAMIRNVANAFNRAEESTTAISEHRIEASVFRRRLYGAAVEKKHG